LQASDNTLIAWAALIAAIGSVLTALLAAIALIAEGRRDRLSIGISNLWKLVEGWDSPEMRLRRALLAKRLRNNVAPRETSDDAIDVLNTFELLAYLVRSETLSLEGAWINFSTWAVSYWYIYETAIKHLQEQDSTLFEDYGTLIRQFIDYEARRRNLEPAAVVPDADALREFLRAEEALLLRISPPQAAREPTESFGGRVVSWLRSWFSEARAQPTPSDAEGEDSGGSDDPS